MRKVLFFIIILFGCNQFLEQNAPLSANYYIEDGWEAFENGDFEGAHQLFSAALVGGDNIYYPHAYVGLGWTCFYYANTLIGSSNIDERETQRDLAYDYFQLASGKFESISIGNDLDLLQHYYDYLSGMTYYYSYNTIKMSDLYYSDNNNEVYWQEMLDYANLLLSTSDSLIEITGDNYNFTHDSTFNNDDIKWVRAQTYIRLNELDAAETEANSISFLQECLEENSVIYCLNNCQEGTCSNNVNP